MSRAVVVGLAGLALAVASAGRPPAARAEGRALDYVVVPPAPPVFAAGPHVIFLDRCAAGCTVTAGSDNAAAGTSSILGRDGTPARVELAAFQWGDDVWEQVAACVRATYAPYDVEVVTTRPAANPYVRVLVAGEASALNLAGNTLGVAPLTSDCSAQASAIAFDFANAHQPGPDQVIEICATAAHEAGHVYGLDHEFECKDPMTYLVGCSTKVFLNKTVACGEFDGPRACKCGATQSSFRKLVRVLGSGPTPPPPDLELIAPRDGATVAAGFSVFIRGQGRPLSVAELWINGARIAAVPGKLTDAPYELRTGAAVPDGVLHLSIRAYDDLGRLAIVTATVQKGAACAAGGCSAGFTCDGAGACVAPAGTAAVGEPCAGDAACASQLCIRRGDDQVCSEPCWPVGAVCAGELSCQHADDERLVCLPPPPEEAGCCGSSRRPGGSVALAALVVGLLRPRRRR